MQHIIGEYQPEVNYFLMVEHWNGHINTFHDTIHQQLMTMSLLLHRRVLLAIDLAKLALQSARINVRFNSGAKFFYKYRFEV